MAEPPRGSSRSQGSSARPISRLAGSASESSGRWRLAVEAVSQRIKEEKELGQGAGLEDVHEEKVGPEETPAEDAGLVGKDRQAAPLDESRHMTASVTDSQRESGGGGAKPSWLATAMGQSRFANSVGRGSYDSSKNLHTVVQHHISGSKRDSLLIDEEALANALKGAGAEAEGGGGGGAKAKTAEGKRYRWLLDPHGKISIYSRWYMGLLLLFTGFFLPLRIAVFPQEVRFYVVDWLIQWSYIADMILQFITGFEEAETGLTCYQPRKIAKRYLQGRFTQDLIATLPWPAMVGSPVMRASKRDVNNLGRALWWLKLIKLTELYSLVGNLSTWRGANEGVVMVLTVLMLILLVVQGLGCGWLQIGLTVASWCGPALEEGFPEGNESSCTWIYRFGYADSRVARQYLAAIYWAMTTLATIGYGDISAHLWQEMIYAIVVEVIGTSWYAYIIGTWSTAMQNFDQRDKALQRRMQGIHAFCRDNKLPPDMARSVRHHYKHALQADHWITYDGEEILGDLPPDVRSEVILHVEKEMIDEISWLEGKDRAFVAEVAGELHARKFDEGDFVFREGVAADNVYFLVEGRVDLASSGQSIEILSAGAVFGLVSIVENRDHRFTAQVVSEHAKCQALTEDAFCGLAERHPEMFSELLVLARNRVARQEKVLSRSASARLSSSGDSKDGENSAAPAKGASLFRQAVMRMTADSHASSSGDGGFQSVASTYNANGQNTTTTPPPSTTNFAITTADLGSANTTTAKNASDLAKLGPKQQLLLTRALLERSLAAMVDRRLQAMQRHVRQAVEKSVKKRLALALNESGGAGV